MKRTFTLVELMIVVAILGIVTAMSIPNLVEARGVANESCVVGSFRTVLAAQCMFREMDADGNGISDYAATLNQLHTDSNIIDSRLGLPGGDADAGGSPTVLNGYLYSMTGTRFAFSIKASPQPNEGRRDFFMDQSGITRFAKDTGANTFEATATSAVAGS